MTETFITSDIHFGHTGILRYEPKFRKFDSIEEHDTKIISRWNETVSQDDVIWILGDLVMNKRYLARINELNGRKRLVMGNHDVFAEGILEPYVHRLFGSVEKRFGEIKTIFTHIPVHTSQVVYRFQFNLHGHLHSKTIKDLRYVNMSMERWGLRPVSFNHILSLLQNRLDILTTTPNEELEMATERCLGEELAVFCS